MAALVEPEEKANNIQKIRSKYAIEMQYGAEYRQKLKNLNQFEQNMKNPLNLKISYEKFREVIISSQTEITE